MTMTPKIEKIIADYKAAYEAAHGHPCGPVSHKNGWFRICGGTPYRRMKLLEMTLTLRKRAAP